jgi:ElaA protein
MGFIENQFGKVPVRLSAQSHLEKFYMQHQFISTGKEYLEDGIPHVEMLYLPKN